MVLIMFFDQAILDIWRKTFRGFPSLLKISSVSHLERAPDYQL